MALETPLYLQPNTGDPAIPYTGQQERVMFDIMSFLAGVTLRGDLKVTQRGAGANMSVDVAAGSAVIAGATVTYQGKYLVRSTATANVTIPAPPGTGSRTDLVVARVYDNQSDASGFYKWQPEVFSGGTVPSGASYIPLASVVVASAVASIVTANITDVRLLNTLGDVPLWEVSGSSGQSITNNLLTLYSGFTVSDAIGMASVSTSTGATISLPGRYLVTGGGRMSAGGSSSTARELTVAQSRGGSRIRTATDNKITSAAVAHHVATTFRCLQGDVISATFTQNSGGTLTLDDTFHECFFTGAWIGP